MAKPPREGAKDESDTEQKLPLGEQITYMPGEGDPNSTKWHGIVFHANIPKTITKPELIEAAKGNPFFKVGTFDASKDGPPAAEFVGDPKNADQYRAHVVGWLKKYRGGHPQPGDIDDLIKTWAAEERLRVMCEVGSDDYSYIGSLFTPIMYELARAAGLNDEQLSKKWAAYGVNQLPF